MLRQMFIVPFTVSVIRVFVFSRLIVGYLLLPMFHNFRELSLCMDVVMSLLRSENMREKKRG